MLCRNARGPEAIRAYARSRRLKPALAATKQRQMKATGHYAGPEDGSFGPASEAALAAWVKARCPGL